MQSISHPRATCNSATGLHGHPRIWNDGVCPGDGENGARTCVVGGVANRSWLSSNVASPGSVPLAARMAVAYATCGEDLAISMPVSSRLVV
jgi:hypothetical protein